MRRFWLCLLLTGCVSLPSTDEISNSLQRFKGRSIEEVVARFGLPDSQRESMGNKVYRWDSDRDLRTSTPVRSTTTGYVSTSLGQVPYRETTVSEQSSVEQLHCYLEIMVDRSEIVWDFGFHGNAGACERFYVHDK